jgi:hypothetical protein
VRHESHDWSEDTGYCYACGCWSGALIASAFPCAPSTDDSPQPAAAAPIDWLALNKDFSA